MPVTIILNYQRTKELCHQFYEAYYSCDRELKVRYLWGAICIIGGYYASKTIVGFLLYHDRNAFFLLQQQS